MSKIIAVDFDGTCVTHEYPDVGADVGAVPVLRKLVNHGNRIILFTMRSGQSLVDAIKWFEQNDIPLFGVNTNPEQNVWTASPKPYANIYIDDAALCCPLTSNIHRPSARPFCDWSAIHDALARKGCFDVRKQNEV